MKASALLATVLAAAAFALPAPGMAQPADTLEAVPAAADSLKSYRFGRPILSEADAMTLREIIQRCVEGENTKLAGIQDMTYTATVRTVVWWPKKRILWDGVYEVFEDDQGLVQSVELATLQQEEKLVDGRWVINEDETEKEDSFSVEVERNDRGKDLARLPFFLKDQAEYDFELLERVLEEDHVIFKIAFKPKSSLKPLPSGTVYVDTDHFRIIHEEFSFAGESPFPLLVKGINRVSRHWRQLPTGEWVTWKILAEIDVRGFWKIPDRVDVAVFIDDYRFNQGFDERKFGKRGKP